MPTKKTQLINLSLKRIAVVDAGDNPDAAILMIKRKDKNVNGERDVDVSDTDVKLSDEQKEAIVKEAVEKALAQAAEETKKAEEKAKADAEAQAAEALQKAKDKVAELEGTKKEADEVVKKVGELEKQLDETRKLLAAHADEKAKVSAVAKVKEWDHVPGITDDNADVLAAVEAVRKSCPKHAEVLLGVIDGCEKVLSESDVFKSVGKDSGDAGSAEAALNAKASEVQKAHSDLSWEEAYLKAWDENPDLVKRYNSEYTSKARNEDYLEKKRIERGIE